MQFEFDKDAILASQGILEDIFEGNITPSEVLEDSQQIELVDEAISLVENFIAKLDASGLVEEY